MSTSTVSALKPPALGSNGSVGQPSVDTGCRALETCHGDQAHLAGGTTKDVLRKAKEVLLRQGWHRGGYCASYTDMSAPVCLRGAVNVVVTGNPFECHGSTTPSLRALEDALGDMNIPFFNDEVAKSIDDVVALIDRALDSTPDRRGRQGGETDAHGFQTDDRERDAAVGSTGGGPVAGGTGDAQVAVG